MQLIKELNTLSPNGYNIATGGNCNIMVGENHPRNTVNDNTVAYIINDLSDGKLSDRDIARKHMTTDKVVADINHGYSHRQDNIQYPIRKRNGLQKLSLQQVEEIIDKLSRTAMTYEEIAKQYGISKGAVYHINKGLTFHDSNRKYPIR